MRGDEARLRGRPEPPYAPWLEKKKGTTQVGSGGVGELLVPWPEAMGLIIQLPSSRDWEGE